MPHAIMNVDRAMTLQSQIVKLDTPARRAYARIKADNALPSPSGVAGKVLRLVRTKAATVESILETLEADPPTAARILKVVNTPIDGISPNVPSLPDAVEHVGMGSLKTVVLAISLVTGQKRVPCAGFAYDRFWSESVGRAAAARHVAQQMNGVSPYKAFAVGLLSRIGCLALATAYRVAYGHILERVRADDSDELARLEQTMFEIDHNELTAEMMDDWGFPGDCSDAVRYQNGASAEGLEPSTTTARLARNLHLATSIASVLVHPNVDLNTLNGVVNEAVQLGIQPGEFHAIFDSIGGEWRYLAAIFAVSRRKVPPLAALYADAYSHQQSTH